ADVATLRIADGLPEVRLDGDGVLEELAAPARDACLDPRRVQGPIAHRPAAERARPLHHPGPGLGRGFRGEVDLVALGAEEARADEEDPPARRVDEAVLVHPERGRLAAQRRLDDGAGLGPPRAEVHRVGADVLDLARLRDEVLVEVGEDARARLGREIDPDLLLTETEDPAVAE